jgi:putative ABC transport system substrate-binding protein
MPFKYLRRRDFFTLVGGAVAIWPRITLAQQTVVPVVGHLDLRSPDTGKNLRAVLRRGLAEMGYAAGQNLVIEFRSAHQQRERLPELAVELVALKPAAIAATGGSAVALAVKAATATIPIVFTAGEDPVKLGLVASLGRPGGNATGASFFTVSLAAKRLDLLHEAAPTMGTIALLVNPKNSREVEAQARLLGLKLVIASARTAGDLEASFAAMSQQGAGALLISADGMFTDAYDLIVSWLPCRSQPPCGGQPRSQLLGDGRSANACFPAPAR